MGLIIRTNHISKPVDAAVQKTRLTNTQMDGNFIFLQQSIEDVAQSQGGFGLTGSQGPIGLQGPIGPTGADGLQGPIGPTGADGLQGPIGPTGADGLQGATGPQGASLSGTQYLLVSANGTDVQNATELQTIYNQAKTMSPTASKVISIICSPGNYNFQTNTFVLDTPFINLVSLDGNRSVVFNATLNTSLRTQGSLSITANNVFVRGIDVLTKALSISSNLNLIRVENCKGGERSFSSSSVVLSGTFVDCDGGTYAFAGTGTSVLSGTFINCTGEQYSFGGFGGTLSGTFINCKSIYSGGFPTYNGFGSSNGICSGTFTDCFGGAFGSNNLASGTFTNCVGGGSAFGGGFGGVASGTFTNCRGLDYSFANSGIASGTFTNCTGTFAAFGTVGTASGTFTNCVGGASSFGSQGRASGTFSNCVGGINSFGGDSAFGGTLTGKLYFCRLTSGSFQTVSGGGITRLCIDGSNVLNNQG